jgi:DNA-binding Lrp family transcriptional regulator
MPNMHTANDSNTNINTVQPTVKKYNIQNLLKEGISREFGTPIDPKKFDTYRNNRATYHGRITTHMKDLRRENLDDWAAVTDEEIATISIDTEIGERIVRMGTDLVLMRKRAHDRAVDLFPNIRTTRADWSLILNVALSDLDEVALKNHVSRTHIIRSLVHTTFPTLVSEIPSGKRDFDRIFGSDKNTYMTTPEQKVRFQKIHKDYLEFNQSPDGSDIDFILTAYAPASIDRKKTLLSELGVTLTIKHAREANLISQDFLRQFAERELGDAYTSLTPDQKESFVRGLEANETYAIPASDFDVVHLGTILASDVSRRKLAQEVYHAISIDSPEELTTHSGGILRDIKHRKEEEAKKTGEEAEYDVYDEFVNELLIKLRTSDGGSSIRNLKLLKNPNAVIQFQDSNGDTQFMRIKKVRDADGNPIEVGDGSNY